MTVLLIAGFLSLFLSVFLVCAFTGDTIESIVLSLIIIISVVTLSWYSNISGQEQALKGQSDYIMNIRYEVRDSTLMPVDTVFTLKN